MNYTRTIIIPFHLKDEELVIDPQDVKDVKPLNKELQWLPDNIDGGAECERIMRSAVLLHDRTRHPMNECLRQAIIWERG